jgi:hypothetical protein
MSQPGRKPGLLAYTVFFDHDKRPPMRDADQPGNESIQLEHQILVLDAGIRAPLDFSRYKLITRRFIDELLVVLGMDPLGDLGIYPAIDQRAPGWSFIQPITTSHVSAHYFEKPGRTPHIRLDAYSCETVDWQRLISVCDQHFALGDWRATFIDRQIEATLERTVIDLTGTGAHVTSERTLLRNDFTDGGESQCKLLAL